MTRYIFRRFYNTINKSTGNLWSTKEVLLNVLQNNLPWLPPGSTLHRIIKINFSVAVDTADIERLMSVFSLQVNALKQHSTPARVEQMVRIKKESAPWQSFDFDSGPTIWQLTKGRKLPLPLVGRSTIPQTGKHLVKPSELIKEHHTRRLNAWRAKNAQQTYIYDSGSSASESDSEEKSCVKLRAIRKMKTIVMKIPRKMMMKGLLVKVFIIIIHYISFCHYLSFVDSIVTLHKT